MNIFFVSLGCDKNLVDSEVMLGLLDAKGYQIVDDETQADVMVINTCCFIHDAKEESIQTILDMARYKEDGRLKALVVTGCLAQRYKQEIIDEIPEVDVVLGTTSYDKIVEAVEEALEGKSEVALADIDALPLPETKRLVTTGGHYAYLKIAEGCDKHCTYCIIPKVRGNYRSVPMERLIKEAQELADQGVKELILVAQETTVYGQDIYGEKSLHKLLKELCQIKGIRWIRLLYCYPEEIDDNLIRHGCCRCIYLRRISKYTQSFKFHLIHEFHHFFMLFLRFSRKTGDQRCTQCNVRDLFSQPADRINQLLFGGSSSHPL